ncbi:unnamed protein product, partial [Vitis vinifera]
MVQEEIRKGPWTEKEDFQLVCFVGLFGDRRWDFIAKVSGLNRTGKSCRLRWVNYLHPGLKRGKMTPHEERLVLELHSQWGNRWSRIARKLPGRTDNEIKNYWRTHMRKKAQERKRAISPSSPSSNCSSSAPHNPKALAPTGKKTEEEKEADKGYSMDDIWKDIAFSEENTIKPVYDGYKEEGCDFACPPNPMASPVWDYCPDSLWRMDEEESKMFLPMSDQFISSYEHGMASLTG